MWKEIAKIIEVVAVETIMYFLNNKHNFLYYNLLNQSLPTHSGTGFLFSSKSYKPDSL